MFYPVQDYFRTGLSLTEAIVLLSRNVILIVVWIWLTSEALYFGILGCSTADGETKLKRLGANEAI